MKYKNKPLNPYTIFAILFLTFIYITLKTHKSGIYAQRIIDGDTITISTGATIRYIGIDTPETRKNINGQWIEVNEPFSQKAKRFNKTLLKNKILKIEYDTQKKDRYNRTLAYCFIDNIMINEKLLKEGLAFLFFMEPNGKYAKKLLDAHIYAIKNKKGIWSNPENIISPQQMANNTGTIKIVCGKIYKAIPTDMDFLLLWDTEFKHYITVPTSVAFRNGTKLKQFQGCNICAEGKIKKKSNRYYIRIFHLINIFKSDKILD